MLSSLCGRGEVAGFLLLLLLGGEGLNKSLFPIFTSLLRDLTS